MNLDLVLSILLKSPSKRSLSDIKELRKQTKQIKFFKELCDQQRDKTVHLECCKVMKYQQLQQDEYVFKFGDPGENFCILIQGSVRVLIPKKRSLQSVKHLQSSSESEEEGEEQAFEEVAALPQGASFGELALLNDSPRAASIQCRENSILGILDKKDYLGILSSYQQKLLTEKVSLFKSNEAFKNYSRGAIVRLLQYFTARLYRPGHVVFSQGDTPEYVFIIKQGEFKYTRRLQSGNLSQRVNISRQAPIVVKTVGQMFGYEEILDQTPERQNTCICVSAKGELLQISKFDFIKRINNPDAWKFIMNINKAQKLWQSDRILQLLQVEKRKNSMSQMKKQIVNKRPQYTANNSRMLQNIRKIERDFGRSFQLSKNPVRYSLNRTFTYQENQNDEFLTSTFETEVTNFSRNKIQLRDKLKVQIPSIIQKLTPTRPRTTSLNIRKKIKIY